MLFLSSINKKWVNPHLLLSIQVLCCQILKTALTDYNGMLKFSIPISLNLYFTVTRILLMLIGNSKVMVYFYDTKFELRMSEHFKIFVLFALKIHFAWLNSWKATDITFEIFDDGLFIVEASVLNNKNFSAKSFFLLNFFTNMSMLPNELQVLNEEKTYIWCFGLTVVKSLVSSLMHLGIYQIISQFLKQKADRIGLLIDIVELLTSSTNSKEGVIVIAQENFHPYLYNKAMSKFLDMKVNGSDKIFKESNNNNLFLIEKNEKARDYLLQELSHLVRCEDSKGGSSEKLKGTETDTSFVSSLQKLFNTKNSQECIYNFYDSRLANSATYTIKVTTYKKDLCLIKFETDTGTATFHKSLKKLKTQLLITILHEVNNSLNCFNYLVEYFPEAQIEERIYIKKQMQRYQANLKYHVLNYCVYFKLVLEETLALKREELNLLQLIFSSLTCILGEEDAYKMISCINTEEISSISLISDRQYLELLLTNCMHLFNQLSSSSAQQNFRIAYNYNKESKLRILFYSEKQFYAALKTKINPEEDTLSIEDSICSIELLKEIISKISKILNIEAYDEAEEIKVRIQDDPLKDQCQLILELNNVYTGVNLTNQISKLKFSQDKVTKQAEVSLPYRSALAFRRKNKFNTEYFIKGGILDSLKEVQSLSKKNSLKHRIKVDIDSNEFSKAIKEFYTDKDEKEHLLVNSKKRNLDQETNSQLKQFEFSLALIRSDASCKDLLLEKEKLSRAQSLKYDTPVEEIDAAAIKKMRILAKKSTQSISKFNKKSSIDSSFEEVKAKNNNPYRVKSKFSKLSFKSASSSKKNRLFEGSSNISKSKSNSLNYLENLGTSGDEASCLNDVDSTKCVINRVFTNFNQRNVISEIGQSLNPGYKFLMTTNEEDDKVDTMPSIPSKIILEPLEDSEKSVPRPTERKRTKFIIEPSHTINQTENYNKSESQSSTCKLIDSSMSTQNIVLKKKLHIKSLSTKEIISFREDCPAFQHFDNKGKCLNLFMN